MERVRAFVQDVRMILRSTASPSSKFITYFQLLDAFKEPGCPVCTRLEQGALNALDDLMYAGDELDTQPAAEGGERKGTS